MGTVIAAIRNNMLAEESPKKSASYPDKALRCLLVLFVVTAISWLSPPNAAATPDLTCSRFLERLGQTAVIEQLLQDHRQRVRARFAGELVTPSLAGQDRKSRVLQLIMKMHSPEILTWFGANGNGAKIFHGSTSASLMAFLPPNSKGLLPNQVLIRDLAIVPLSGRFDSLGSGDDEESLNMVGLNVVGLGRFGETFDYAYLNQYQGLMHWENEVLQYEDPNRKAFQSNSGTYRIELLKKRIELAKVLAPTLKWHFEEPFPVIYGFALREDSLVWRPVLDGPHTIIADNLSPQELRIVLVPMEFIDRVKGIMSQFSESSSISVRSLSEVNVFKLPSEFDRRFSDLYHRTKMMTDEQIDRLLE